MFMSQFLPIKTKKKEVFKKCDGLREKGAKPVHNSCYFALKSIEKREFLDDRKVWKTHAVECFLFVPQAIPLAMQRVKQFTSLGFHNFYLGRQLEG